MIIQKFDSEKEWLEAREGKVTGSKLKDILVKKKGERKIGTYKLIADRVSVKEEGNEPPMDRGKRLETQAMKILAKETGKKFNTDLVIFMREDNQDIAYSPDGYIKAKKIKVVAEIKCLDSKDHIRAFITKEIPDYQGHYYRDQVIQAFIVNDDLEIVYMGFYDPRVKEKPFFYFTITRESLQEEISEYIELEKIELEFADMWIKELTF
jgi:hypothetical protein